MGRGRVFSPKNVFCAGCPHLSVHRGPTTPTSICARMLNQLFKGSYRTPLHRRATDLSPKLAHLNGCIVGSVVWGEGEDIYNKDDI